MPDTEYQYTMVALQILALSPERLDSYLPPPFPKTRFHGYFGDFFCTSPLSAIVMICGDCLDRPPPDILRALGRESEAVFAALSQQLNELDLPDEHDREMRDAMCEGALTDTVQAMQRCRDGAVHILTRLGYLETNEAPVLSARQLLDAWSYGAYSEQSRQLAEGAPVPETADRPDSGPSRRDGGDTTPAPGKDGGP